jgi:plastocyanin
MKRLTQLIPLSVMVVLLFVSVAAAQSIPDQSGGTANNSLVLIGFGPSGFGDITVDPGTTVTWINRDTKPHTVTADDAQFDSGVLNPGESFTVNFEGSGTLTYHCQIHPEMVGSVTVSGDSSNASEATQPAGETIYVPGGTLTHSETIG